LIRQDSPPPRRASPTSQEGRPVKVFIADHRIVTPAEYLELALGIDRELFAGPRTPETPEQHAARLDAARDIIDQLRAEGESELADHAERLMRSARVHLLLGGVPGRGKGRSALPGGRGPARWGSAA
jgi:hypothetical protein